MTNICEVRVYKCEVHYIVRGANLSKNLRYVFIFKDSAQRLRYQKELIQALHMVSIEYGMEKAYIDLYNIDPYIPLYLHHIYCDEVIMDLRDI